MFGDVLEHGDLTFTYSCDIGIVPRELAVDYL